MWGVHPSHVNILYREPRKWTFLSIIDCIPRNLYLPLSFNPNPTKTKECQSDHPLFKPRAYISRILLIP